MLTPVHWGTTSPLSYSCDELAMWFLGHSSWRSLSSWSFRHFGSSLFGSNPPPEPGRSGHHSQLLFPAKTPARSRLPLLLCFLPASHSPGVFPTSSFQASCSSSGRWYCPVPSCPDHCPLTCRGWSSVGSMKWGRRPSFWPAYIASMLPSGHRPPTV